MHNLALALAARPGYYVTGSDDEIFDPARTNLQRAGLLPPQMGWFPERITSDLDAVILGMHARGDNPELIRARELGLKIYSFPEFLYDQTKTKTRIVIAGSHGKSTTTSLVLYALKQLGIEADYMVGAQIAGFEGMVRLSDSARYAVFEGDEYLTSALDRRSKFLLYHPHIALITGIAWDHINVFPKYEDYVGTFKLLTDTIEPKGTFVYYEPDKELSTIAQHVRKDITVVPYRQYEGSIPMGLFGSHNMQNIAGACAVCQAIGISSADFYQAVSSFQGAAQRLQCLVKRTDRVGYIDFAHSPSKLKATVGAVKEKYPDKHLVACMELHTFSSLNKAFLPQYHESMCQADTAIVYYNPKVVEHKRLTPFTPADVQAGFGGSTTVEVFTDSNALQQRLRGIDYTNSVLLMMTSGTFDGIDIPAFMNEVL